ncbi:MAG: hypothetical protein EAZ47_00220 [Bacteroidetes bacterium]|nr:MAG: hypothetical protein EAY72_12455 [Bacteroidota bacterium]TAE70053.1 MAG: hypothetical protein EAY68_03185 [Bacteroidota bacterium]TAF98469.1 MAG: hypothetical protein EAZ47_00220 [Bacteroidota bacterium]
MNKAITNRQALHKAIAEQKMALATKEQALQKTLELLPKQSLQALLGGLLPAVASTQLTNAIFGVAGLVMNIFGGNKEASTLQAGIGKVLKQVGFVGLLRVLWRVLSKK